MVVAGAAVAGRGFAAARAVLAVPERQKSAYLSFGIGMEQKGDTFLKIHYVS